MENKPNVLKGSYVIIPIVIGLAVIAWLFYKDFDPELFASIQFSGRMLAGILLAFLFMFGRDLGLMCRYRIISDYILNWRQAFRVNMLCEFTSAVTPSAVGGSSLIVLFLNREGINAGKSTTLMITSLFLDELFLVIFCPIILILLPFDKLFGDVAVISVGIKILFFIVYTGVALWTLLLYIALFKKPEWIKKLLLNVFRLPFIRRWRKNIEELTDNLVMSSQEISRKPFTFWLKAFGATCFAWISRYLVVDALLMAFTTTGSYFLAFARQLILWIIMMVSPTPGGSGVSEYMFSIYYADFFSVAGMALVVAFVWRIITYYMYLIIGVFILPRWIGGFKK